MQGARGEDFGERRVGQGAFDDTRGADRVDTGADNRVEIVPER